MCTLWEDRRSLAMILSVVLVPFDVCRDVASLAGATAAHVMVGDGGRQQEERRDEGSLRPACFAPEIEGVIEWQFAIALAHIDDRLFGSVESL